MLTSTVIPDDGGLYFLCGWLAQGKFCCFKGTTISHKNNLFMFSKKIKLFEVSDWARMLPYCSEYNLTRLDSYCSAQSFHKDYIPPCSTLLNPAQTPNNLPVDDNTVYYHRLQIKVSQQISPLYKRKVIVGFQIKKRYILIDTFTLKKQKMLLCSFVPLRCKRFIKSWNKPFLFSNSATGAIHSFICHNGSSGSRDVKNKIQQLTMGLREAEQSPRLDAEVKTIKHFYDT